MLKITNAVKAFVGYLCFRIHLLECFTVFTETTIDRGGIAN